MADAMVERRPSARFFCHRCNIEFEDVLQDYICPYCASGFIEQLESEGEGMSHSGDDFSDADMSNLDDSDDMNQSASHPMLGDLAFMSGGQTRRGRPETLVEQLFWTMYGGAGPAGGGAVTAGAPFVFVGAPGDYVFGGEGLDAVVTQLLGQLENAGPPPLSRDQIAAIPSEPVSPEQAAANTSCSVCWENFLQGETVSRLECDHIFHSGCMEPWLRLHATCPICRRSLLADDAPPAPPAALDGFDVLTAANPAHPAHPPPAGATHFASIPIPRVLLRRLPRRLVSNHQTQTWDSPVEYSVDSPPESSSSAGSMSTGSSVTAGGVWAPHTRSNTNSTGSNSSSSLNSSNDRERQYNMDIDFD